MARSELPFRFGRKSLLRPCAILLGAANGDSRRKIRHSFARWKVPARNVDLVGLVTDEAVAI